MPVKICRVCGGALFGEPLLHYRNMPGAAQHLPDAAALATERGADLDVCQCADCGLVQLGNDPVPYWREVIRAAAFSPEMGNFRKEQFLIFVRDHSLAGKKVVEIGCGRGEYLSLMRDAGVDAYGVEFGAESVRHCVSAGLTVEQGFVESETVRLAHAPFNAFFIMNFLEHLPNPNAVLHGVRNNLVDGAVGLVEVPNFDMILRKNLFSEFIGDHLFYFTTETLNSTLTMNGFEILESRVVWHDYIISTVVRKRPGAVECAPSSCGAVRRPLDLSRFAGQQAQLKEELEAYIARFGMGKVAVWGAGHQALAVLALADLGGKIKCVVDSAPFKQGKYTPATHIPIVAPDCLRTDPVAAVIVMAAAYSDEVAGIIRQRFGNSMAVAILRDSGLECV